MNASESFGNNPLHKACRFRNHRLIKLLLEANIGAIDKRNLFGRLPLEMPHNDIMNDLKVRKVFDRHLRTNEHLKKLIRINKEPDYMFVVNKEREEVLID